MSRSFRRLGALGACAAAAVVLSGPVPASAAVDLDFTLYAKEVASQQSGPTGQPPETGAVFTFADDIYRTKGGDVVGRDGVTCTVVRTGSSGNDLLCVGNVVLNGGPGGQLTLQALTSADPSNMQTAAFDAAVTGGTGDFKDVGGYVRLTADGDYERMEFHLNR
ncbi:hypothetical protein [Streptomyces sp. NPDC093225]|uniref:hypothetical protein n=1 Tax=Streptomyces sp. NPDC093225 TaxID=3366034 RepID=UPI00382E0D16